MSCALCNVGDEKQPAAGIKLNYGDDFYSQVFGELVSCFRHLTNDKLLSPCDITPNDFRSYNRQIFYVFDIRYQKTPHNKQRKYILVFLF